MKIRYTLLAVAMFCVALVTLVPSTCAQETKVPQRNGFPQDWSQNHIVFSFDGLAKHPELITRETRVQQQVIQRFGLPTYGSFQSESPSISNATGQTLGPDWSVAMSGRLDANTYPAKFSFYPNAPPSCTTDFVAFGLAAAGTVGGHANLVGFDNLYVNTAGTGFCSGTAPSVLFAYDVTTVTGGKITTSPFLSLDGTKIAFIESVPANTGTGTSATTIFHVLTWTRGAGTIAAAAAPTMTSLVVSSTANDTASSPWIDYGGDIAFVGTDDGVLHEIVNVFSGTPAADPSPFPVTVSAGLHLSPPVFDELRNVVMVGSSNGDLYKVNVGTGAVSAKAIGAKASPGIVAAPIVDITNGTTFVVTADVGYAAALVEINTTTMSQLSLGEIGVGESGGATAITIYEPAFSNAYFTNPASGVITACGTGTGTDTSPWQYVFGFNGDVMKETALSKQQLSTATTSRCSPITEFYNPNINGGTDFFFFGVTQDCTSTTGGATTGCVAEETNLSPATPISTPIVAQINGGTSGIIVDNYSTAAQASSIYFTALNLQTAYKFSQNGLQ